MRDLNDINKGIWIYRYYDYTTTQQSADWDRRVAESKFYLHDFTKPASKIFDKRRNIKDRLKKKRNVERSISKIIEGNLNLNINILVNIDTSSEEMELLSEILENNDIIYFPKIEIYIRHNILIIPVFQTSKIIEHIAGRSDSHSYSYSPEYDFVGNYGSGFFIINSANKKEKERYNVKGK